MIHSSLTDYASGMSIHQTMTYSVILFMVFIITFLGILSMSSVHTSALPQSRSVLTVTSQKQFNEWQKESDHAEASDDYVG